VIVADQIFAPVTGADDGYLIVIYEYFFYIFFTEFSFVFSEGLSIPV